ncbi:hypothetical protein LOZ35_003083 [Ophidiomyces ophidiicola]|nr:hypothetical protein LOZ35_003083 [Ophidiomyces ophidiicola]
MCTPPPSRSLADELHNHHHNQQPITPLQPARPPPLETPSRLVGFSPGLFASPDLFSLAAPDLGLASVYGDPFAASVADDSSCFGPGPLLQRPPSLPPQHDLPTAYSAIAIATSPRPPPQPAPDDPALFLSSPARRFGLSDATALSSPPPPPPPPPTRPVETRQPYHYQTEACEREKRDRLAGKLSLAKNAARRPHTTRVESAAYHPPAPAPKPGKRSVTHSGTPVRHQRQSSLSLAAAAPVLGGAGVKKTPSKGRSSPLKPTVVSRAPPMESLVLKISKDGLATTEMKLLARDSSTEIDSDSSDGEDDDEDRFTHSQNPSFAVPVATPRRPDFIRAQSTSRPPSHGSAYSSSTHSPWTASSHSRRARTSFQRDHTTPTKSAPRRSRSHSLSDSDTPHHDSRPGDAQHALMEVLKCRKRQSRPLAPGSARTVSHYSQSSALSALPSSPPSYHSRSRATGSASPTTLIDTELPTPVADRQNNPSTGTRCVCRSMNNGGHLMIQWYSLPVAPIQPSL